MKMVRLSTFALVLICCSAALLAQSPPQITNTLFDFETVEQERVSLLVRLSDPDPDESLTLTFSLANAAALGISESQLQFNFKSKTFDGSSLNVSNQFSVPVGTVGSTLEIQAVVTDKDSLTASRVFRYRVVGSNQPPVISLSVSQPGSSAAGTQADPFRFGSLQLRLTIQDDAGVDDYTYGLQIVSGTLCVNYPFFWFGREGLTPTVDVPKVATLMALSASATVQDGTFTETVSRTVWVAPEPEGCSSGGGGGGTSPLDSVTATGSPNPVSPGGFISLVGSMTGDASPYSATWYLGSATSGEQLIASGWQAQYQAPNFATTLNFRFKVEEIAGPDETSKSVPVTVSSGGGGGGTSPPPPLPPPPSCGCAGGGLPPGVNASADSTTVLGGQSLGLSGVASDPNYPLGAPGPAPTVLWKVEDSGGISGLNIVGANQANAQLTTPSVQSSKWILLSLNAKNQSNACECLDYLQVQVLSEANAGGTSDALLQYAWPGGAFQPATDSTVASSVVIPFQLRLKANPSGFTSPTFKWETNRSDGTFSPSDTVQEPTLLVTGQSGETAISLSVTLTVTEAGDPSTSEQATANFQLIVTGASAAPGNADFVMSEESAEPGTLVTLEGSAESASGQGAAELEYFWNVVTGDGVPVDVLTSHNRAIFEVPTASETSSAITVTMTAAENGVPSAPVVKGLDIASPTLRFAHFGAGPTGGQILEVQLIVVNDSEEPVEESGRLWFVKQDGTPNSVMVDDELVEDGVMPFSVGPESSRMFKIVTPDEDLRVGWMAVSSPVPLEGVVLFQYVDADSGRVQTETSLFASETGKRVSIAVDGRAGAIGFAIANPSSDNPVDCIVGIPINGAALEVPVTLQPLEQKALFLSQFHELVDPNMKVSGTLFLEVQGSEGSVVTTVLRLTSAGLSTLPVAVRKE
jgi:hypothetical protein